MKSYAFAKGTFSLFIVICLNLSPTIVQAQFFKKVMDKAQDKLVDKIEDELSEKIAEEIAARAYRPIDKAFEDLWMSSFPKDSTGQVDWEAVNESYGDMLNNMDKSAELPPSYSYDVSLTVEAKDYDGEKAKMIMYLTEDGSIMGIRQLEADKEEQFQLIVIDIKRDIIAMYDVQKKSGQAIGNMLGMAGTMAANATSENSIEIEKTGKTKKILEYTCQEYKGESETEKSKFYLAEDFVIDWKDAYSGFLKQFANNIYREEYNDMTGMILKSTSQLQGKRKKSSWEVKKVDTEIYTINNADYTFKPLTEQE